VSDNDQLLNELKAINNKLDKLTNPLKVSYLNFIAGIFHSLGTLFGTVVVAAAIVFLLSKINLTGIFSQFINRVFSQVNWSQIIPTPKLELPQL
jgi:hypothetical protein